MRDEERVGEYPPRALRPQVMVSFRVFAGPSRALAAVVAVTVAFVSPVAVAQRRGADAGASAAVTLRFRHTQGGRGRYLVRSSQTAQRNTTNITQTLEIETQRVQADRSAELRARTLAFDMESGPLPPAQRRALASSMLSAVYLYRADERGRVVSQPVQGLRSSLAELGESAWQTVESSIPTLPEGPVAVGASWSETRQTRVMVGVTRVAARVDVTYTLREIRRAGTEQTAVIGVAMNLTVSQSVGAPNINATGRGQARGEVQFSVERGALLRSTSTMQLDVTVTARGANPSTINMTGSSELALQG